MYQHTLLCWKCAMPRQWRWTFYFQVTRCFRFTQIRLSGTGMPPPTGKARAVVFTGLRVEHLFWWLNWILWRFFFADCWSLRFLERDTCQPHSYVAKSVYNSNFTGLLTVKCNVYFTSQTQRKSVYMLVKQNIFNVLYELLGLLTCHCKPAVFCLTCTFGPCPQWRSGGSRASLQRSGQQNADLIFCVRI